MIDAIHCSSGSSVLLCLVLSLSACSSSSSPGTNSNDSNPPATNRPPTISGTPMSTAVQNQIYEFIPSANDPDSDSLSFSAINLPSWVDFDSENGALSGRPESEHIGAHEDISISVSDGFHESTLGPFTIEVVASATSAVTLTWQAPTVNADGSPLLDLSGYLVRWGTVQGSHPNVRQINNASVSTFVVEELAPGTYFFTVSALDTSGNESAPSNEAQGTAQ